jgi:hypothetical protein
LTLTETGWMDDLIAIAAEPGATFETVPPTASGLLHASGPAILAMKRETVRKGLRQRGRFGENPDANLTSADRERMRTMLNKLKDKGKIGLSADMLWLL